ncbi:MAG: S8 family serine peptidase [Clostridiales bacterium]|nr:S8 family serine peptidase [Clostridiales bacterium]
MKKCKNILLCCLALCIVFSAGLYTVSVKAVEIAEKSMAKLSSELRQALENEETSVSNKVFVVMQDVDHDEVMEEFSKRYPEEYAVYIAAKYDSAAEAQIPAVGGELADKAASSYRQTSYSSAQDAVLQRAIEKKREIYREYYAAANVSAVASRCSAENRVFVSEYAPVAIVELNKNEIMALSRSSKVVSMDAYAEKEGAPASLELANKITRADYVRDTYGNSGSGVKIGIVEAVGIPDTNDSYLSSATIYKRPGDTTVALHATEVARILVGTDSTGANDGLAPNASLYCCVSGSSTSFYSSVEWLLSSGVNIINASVSFDYAAQFPNGLYDSMNQWIDHIAVQHDVHFVIAAGNAGNGNGNISCPGMAYNAITVGGLDAHGSDSVAGFTIASTSSYKESEDSNRPEKPNLVASSVDIWGTGSAASGTSFAAPQAAGTIAQLCSLNSALKTKQAAVGAILMASAAEKVEAVGNGSTGDVFLNSVRVAGQNGFAVSQVSDKEGAGILDARWARGIVHYGNFWSYTIAASGFPYNKNITINASSNSLTRIAVFWLKRNSVTNHNATPATQVEIADLNLSVYGPNGSLLAVSDLAEGNFEIVQFVPPSTGTYTITIGGSASDKEHIGIAVW